MCQDHRLAFRAQAFDFFDQVRSGGQFRLNAHQYYPF